MARNFATFNKQVAVRPPKDNQQVATKLGGLKLIDEKLSLLELEVVFYASDSNGSFEPGDRLYIHGGDARNQTWYKNVYSVDGVEFILVPESHVLLASSAT